jgi:RNA polymerase sigma factor (sigma-70 family)
MTVYSFALPGSKDYFDAAALTRAAQFSSVPHARERGSAVTDSEERAAATLAEAILKGDSYAEELLYARYHKQLVLILQRRGVPAGQCDDIAHEAYIVTLQRLRDGKLTQPELVGRYLKRTAINTWLNEVRKSIRHGDTSLEVVGDDIAHSPEGDGESLAESAEMADVVRAIVAELSQERDRLVLLLSYVYDWDKQSVCDYVGLESRVYDSIRSRALKRCREILERNPQLRRSVDDLSEVSRP